MPAFWGYPPPPHDYPYYWFILDPKSKEDKVKVINLQNLPKLKIFEFWNKLYMRHTLSSCLIRCANMPWIRQVLLKIQMDRRTRWNQYTPLTTSLKRGGIIRPGGYHNEFAHQIWTQPKKQFSYSWTETARPIRGQEMMRIHQCVFKSLSGPGSPKFELKLIRSLAANAWKPLKCNEQTNGEAIPMSPSNSVDGGQLTLYVLNFSEGT